MDKDNNNNKIDSEKTGTLYEQIADHISLLIDGGTYRPGEKIPSVRKTSKQMKVSVSTVLQAYALLENNGIIEAKPQSGYYVSIKSGGYFPEPDISTPEHDPSSVSIHELTMMILKDVLNPNLVGLGAAAPNVDLLPTEKLNKILASLTRRQGARGINYDVPPGERALRVQIAKLMVKCGCSLKPSEFVITSGCMEAFDLCLKAVCSPGDTVAIGSPTYFGILQTMEVMGLKALEIPTHPRDGISVDALAFAMEQTPVKAVLVVSNFHNPLGCCIPDEKKRQLVELIEEKQIPLIEIDISGELYFESRPSVCKAYDKTGLVMYCSSFSKTICPGYRVGWVASGRFHSQLAWLKYTSSVSTATFPQLAVAEYLESGGYEHHMRKVRKAYQYNMDRMAEAVMRYFPPETKLTRPSGGFVFWVELPKYVDSLALYKSALENGITISPGHIFSPSKRYRNFIRLTAAKWSDKIEQAIARLGDLMDQFPE